MQNDNAAKIEVKQDTPLQIIEDNLSKETSCLLGIEGRLCDLLNRLRGSQPEGESGAQHKEDYQGTIGNVRERIGTNQSIISRIENNFLELEGIL